MTDEQIEAAARMLGELRGIKPDAFSVGAENNPNEIERRLQDEVRRFAEVGTAIAAVMPGPPKRVRKKKE